jgi:hypothetical protein
MLVEVERLVNWLLSSDVSQHVVRISYIQWLGLRLGQILLTTSPINPPNTIEQPPSIVLAAYLLISAAVSSAALLFLATLQRSKRDCRV